MKIRIVGTSGSGKSRLAERVSTVLGVPRLELDAVFWDAEWTFRDLDEAHRIITEFVAAHPEGWVMDGNWTSRLGDALDGPDGADLTVWIDHSRARTLGRVVRRTLRRAVMREELWHGNRERPGSWLKLDPEENIVLWSWTQHPVGRARLEQRIAAGEPIVRLRGQRAVDAWIRALRDDASAGRG
ncbi:toxin [Microbacterium horticulturae]|uniref:Toxin n=1 Tax=Microbacterium horticulturae TaxID=3028316 RepID=A0ABY8BZH2_9MICO|nr:toxin [Microbacterium sp. KACC 23027]WEG09596.1 toxin [Microbacterium sp. KACC 23027]